MKHTKLAFALLSISCGISTLACAASGYYSSDTPPADNSGYYSGAAPTQGQPGYTESSQQTVIYTTREKRAPKQRASLQWIQARAGRAPKSAVIGGHENNGKLIFICKAPFRGGVHPGKVVGYNCNIGYDGKEIITPGYEMLISNAYYSWSSASNGEVPPFAFVGGFEDGHPLYVCQARYSGGVHPGKVVGGNCNITYGGKEIGVSRYNVLVTR